VLTLPTLESSPVVLDSAQPKRLLAMPQPLLSRARLCIQSVAV